MNTISQCVGDANFINVRGLGFDHLHMKLESLNPAGSIKLKTAIGLVDFYEKKRQINSHSILIESSSGNLGVALSLICAERGYPFVCVVDPNTNINNIKMMEAFGATVITVTETDNNGGYLGTRINYIRNKLDEDDRYIWLNQYSCPANPDTHAATTAKAIHRAFPRLDYLFVGAGTTGTLMGCTRYFHQHAPETRIIAVDSLGSVTFGQPPGKRFIPGLGSSQMPPIFNSAHLYDRLLVDECAAVGMCRWLARTNGVLAGGSTGTVLAGFCAMARKLNKDATCVVISPDTGERYLDSIYNDEWVNARFNGMKAVLEDPSRVFSLLDETVTRVEGE